jgi:type IV fimbrial biogenesis protein FimT
MDRKLAGFTLIEAMVAMAIVAIGLAVAVPAYSGAVSATRTEAAKVDLATTLIAALNHSTLTQAEVVVCSSGDGASCNGGVDWTGGWIAFADLDGNRAHGANETLLHRQDALDGGTRLRSTSQRTRIVFQPHGGAAAGSNVTFTLCDGRGPAKATTLVLANSGRLRQGAPTIAAATACVYSQ